MDVDTREVDEDPPGTVPHPLARWIATALAVAAERRDTVIRLIRYATVSVVSTTTSLVTLGALVGLAGVPAVWSNVIATAVGTAPSFELNRRWVWRNDGRRSLFGQVVPFVALSFAGLVISTLAVGVVAGHTSGWGHWRHTVAILAANVAAYGALWVVQYRLLDRFLFRRGVVPVGSVPEPELSGGLQTTTRLSGRAGPKLSVRAHRSSVMTYEREDHG